MFGEIIKLKATVSHMFLFLAVPLLDTNALT